MNDQEWFNQIGICYDPREEDGEDPLAPAKGSVYGIIGGLILWAIILAAVAGIFL